MKIQQKRLTDDEEKQLVKDYENGKSIKAILNQYGFSSKKSIYDKIKKHYPNTYKEIINNRNKNYVKDISFKYMDDKFKAYFIGLMITDGYICDDRIELDLCDEDCIQFIANYLEYPYHKYEYNNKTIFRIAFRNKKWVEELKRFGITQKKSYTIPYLNLNSNEERYIPYLIRGIIDGDGCIYWTTKHTIGFYICTMSKDFADWIKDTLENKLFMEDILLSQQQNKIWIISSHKYSNILKLIAIIYSTPFGMNRKFNTLREMFRDYNKSN